MKIRESGMPAEDLWMTFFDAEVILDRMGLRSLHRDVVDLGCGYGTFSLPATRRTNGSVYAFDVEPDMVRVTRQKAGQLGVENLIVTQRDILSAGTGLLDGSAGYVMVFNILHAAQPLTLLAEAYRVLCPGGRVGVIHWNPDPTTPRGPPMDIRPRPEQCRAWLRAAGFTVPPGIVSLPPFH